VCGSPVAKVLVLDIAVVVVVEIAGDDHSGDVNGMTNVVKHFRQILKEEASFRYVRGGSVYIENVKRSGGLVYVMHFAQYKPIGAEEVVSFYSGQDILVGKGDYATVRCP
jgi:hypothetical protein